MGDLGEASPACTGPEALQEHFVPGAAVLGLRSGRRVDGADADGVRGSLTRRRKVRWGRTALRPRFA
jgi:hypothetical protein